MSDELPPKADIRWLIATAKDQGERGTCVAFATTACHEAAVEDAVDYAEEAVYWGAIAIQGFSDGITLGAAGQTLSVDGQPDSESWPYDGQRDESLPGYGPPATAEACRPWHLCTLGRTRVDVDDFRTLIAQGMPVTILIPIFEQFFTPVGGRVLVSHDLVLMEENHAIVLVGYDDVERHFLFRNSWGIDWGNQGHALISYEFVARYALDAARIVPEA